MELATYGASPDILPSDDQEEDRHDMLHAMMLTLMDGKILFAPLESNPQRALDLGTGTGV